MTQTAMEELIHDYKNGKFNLLHPIAVEKLLEKYLNKDKEQMIRFAISCHQDILRDRNAPENLISENLLLFEQYYNQTYGKGNL